MKLPCLSAALRGGFFHVLALLCSASYAILVSSGVAAPLGIYTEGWCYKCRISPKQ